MTHKWFLKLQIWITLTESEIRNDLLQAISDCSKRGTMEGKKSLDITMFKKNRLFKEQVEIFCMYVKE